MSGALVASPARRILRPKTPEHPFTAFVRPSQLTKFVRRHTGERDRLS